MLAFDLPADFDRMPLHSRLRECARQVDPERSGGKRFIALLVEAADELLLYEKTTTFRSE